MCIIYSLNSRFMNCGSYFQNRTRVDYFSLPDTELPEPVVNPSVQPNTEGDEM
jgi:hypothetical protein